MICIVLWTNVQSGQNKFSTSKWTISPYRKFYNINAKIAPTQLIPLDYRYNKISCFLALRDSFDSFHLLSKRISFYAHGSIKFEFSKPHLNSHRQRFSEVAQHTCFVGCFGSPLSPTCGVRTAATSDVSDRCNFRGHDLGSSNEQEKRAGISGKRTDYTATKNTRLLAFGRNKTRVLYLK